MYEAFKRARNRIRKHQPMAIILRCMELLNKPQTSEQMRHYPPHFLLLLMKWTFLYGRYHAGDHAPVTGRAFNGLGSV
jgi:hypothetical protein